MKRILSDLKVIIRVLKKNIQAMEDKLDYEKKLKQARTIKILRTKCHLWCDSVAYALTAR